MAITDDLRKTLSDPTPLYFAAGTADLALQQARKVPVLVEQLASEAPARIEAVRSTDPKLVRERAAAHAREAQARVRETQESLQNKVGELISGVDTDFRKLGETAQDIAMRGVGIALEYAIKARETYEKVAEHGEQAVRTWRGEAAEGIEDVAVAVEPKTAPKATPAAPAKAKSEPSSTARKTSPAKTTPARTTPVRTTTAKTATAKTTTAKKAPSRGTTTARKTTPPTS